jgi:hypothetical protein
VTSPPTPLLQARGEEFLLLNLKIKRFKNINYSPFRIKIFFLFPLLVGESRERSGMGG